MRNWYALYTKPRKEIKIAEQLKKLGFTVYLPLKVEIKQWSDRKKKVTSPLLSSYVFIHIEESKRADIFIIDGVLNYVFWLGQPAIIRKEEIELMRSEIDKPNENVFVSTIEPGERIQLQQGAFKGQMAVIERLSNQKVHLFLLSLGIKLVISRTAI